VTLRGRVLKTSRFNSSEQSLFRGTKQTNELSILANTYSQTGVCFWKHNVSARDLRKVTINFGSCNQHQYTHSGMNSAKFPE